MVRSIVVLTLFAWFTLVHCTSPAAAEKNRDGGTILTVGVPKAPPALPVLRMKEIGALGDMAELRLAVWITPEQGIAMSQDGKHQIVALPLTVAAKLYSKGVGIRLVNVNTWDMASLVSAEPGVAGWRDLAGKTLFVPLKSSTPDALTRYFLDLAGVDADREVHMIYAPAVEIAQLFLAGRARNAVLLEPYVTSVTRGDAAARQVSSFADEWAAIKGPGRRIPNAGMTVVGQIESDLVRRFDAEYAKALAWVLENPDEAAALAEKHLGMRAEVMASAIPGLGLLHKSGRDAAAEVEEFFGVLGDFSPDLIGKTVPDATFYWE